MWSLILINLSGKETIIDIYLRMIQIQIHACWGIMFSNCCGLHDNKNGCSLTSLISVFIQEGASGRTWSSPTQGCIWKIIYFLTREVGRLNLFFKVISFCFFWQLLVLMFSLCYHELLFLNIIFVSRILGSLTRIHLHTFQEYFCTHSSLLRS